MTDEPPSARPRHDRPCRPWAETVVYEAHVRGMTMLNAAVPAELRGTFAGMAHPSVLAHLKNLGVTTVELLPVFAFRTEPEVARRGLTNYWGYNTVDYFTAHRGYASSDDAVAEFSSMVGAFHAAGLEIILDVVYNHTAKAALAPDWYRHDGAHPVDFSGCGNTLDASNPDVQDFIIGSLRFWAEDTGVDGFRFDLGTALARDSNHRVEVPGHLFERVADDPVLGRLKLIVEPWDATGEGYAIGQFGSPYAEWNDKFRDDLRDYWRGTAHGVGALATRIAGSSDVFDAPLRSVNFITAHDGFTLRDLVSYDDKHNAANGEGDQDGHDDNHSDNGGIEGETTDAAIIDRRQQRAANLLASMMLARGVPMLRMGDEFGHTQGGNNNAYCQDNAVSWMPWRAEPGWDLRRLIGELAQARPLFASAYFPRADEDCWFAVSGLPMSAADWADDTRTGLGMRVGHAVVWFEAAAEELWLRAGELAASVRVTPLGLTPC